MSAPSHSPASRSSSQATVSASRWLVGSSSANSAGRASSARASATRRRSPPDRVPMRDSSGGSCSAAASERTSCSRSQPPAASMRACSRACSSSAACSLSPPSAGIFDSRAPSSASAAACARKPSRTTSPAVRVGSSAGSCGTYSSVSSRCRVMSPLSGSSAPTISLSSVDLPAPLSPTMPTRSRASTANDTPASTTRVPNALPTFWTVRIAGTSGYDRSSGRSPSRKRTSREPRSTFSILPRPCSGWTMISPAL